MGSFPSNVDHAPVCSVWDTSLLESCAFLTQRCRKELDTFLREAIRRAGVPGDTPLGRPYRYAQDRFANGEVKRLWTGPRT